MSQLSPRSRALLERAREDLNPDDGELAQVKARVRASVVAGHETKALAIPFLFPLLGAAGLVTLAVAGTTLWRSLDRSIEPAPVPVTCRATPAPTCPAPIDPPQCPPVPLCAQAAPIVPLRKSTNIAPAPSTTTPPTRERVGLFSRPMSEADRRSLEIGLLSDARIALDEGHALTALTHVQKHQQLFPNTTFLEERVALEALTRCALGQRERADAPIQQLVELEPHSTYLPRVHAACREKENADGP